MKAVIAVVAAVGIALATLPAQAQQVERVTMMGGPPAGVFGIFATGISTYLSKAVPNLNVSVAATAGSVENPRRVNAGEGEIGISFSSDVHEAYSRPGEVSGQAADQHPGRRRGLHGRRAPDHLFR